MISFSSPPASSESSSTRDSAVAISGADSRGILEEPLPSTSSEEEDPLAGELHVCSGHLSVGMPTSQTVQTRQRAAYIWEEDL